MTPTRNTRYKLKFPLLLLLFSTSLMSGINDISAQKNSALNAAESLQSETKLNLALAIQTALANNHDIKGALLDVRVAKQDVLNAWAEVMPDVNTNFNYTRNLEIPVNFVPAVFFDPTAGPDELVPLAFGTDNNWTGGFSVTQNIFKGEALVGISSAELYLSAQQEGKRQIAQQVVTQTRLSFNQVLFAKEDLELQSNIIDRLKENLRQNKARVEAGLIDSYEVLRLEVALSNQLPELTNATYALEQAYRDLSIVMGLPADFKIPIEGDLSKYEIMSLEQATSVNQTTASITELTPISKLFPTEAFVSRSDLNLLDLQRQLKIRETQAYKSRYLPTITAEYAWQWTAAQPGRPNFFGNSDQRARFQTLGLNITMPIFNGMSRSVAIQKAIIERKNIEVQQDKTKQLATAEILKLNEAFLKIKDIAEARIKAMAQAKRGYDISKSRFQEGLGTQLDVDEAEEQMQTAETNYAAMILEYLTTKAQYDQAIGKVPFVDIPFSIEQ